jgi:uncharacterized repeat protein (TIGR03803 family)
MVTIAAAAMVLALAPLTAASAYTLETLHSFCNTEQLPNCVDGDTPLAGLLRDGSGKLFGTTSKGGKYGGGFVFKLVPSGGKYTEYSLHNFCAKANCTDGTTPDSDLIMDVTGNLYGTTLLGGKYGGGIVFRLTPGENRWSLAILHNFCASGCTSGFEPGALTYAGQASGALYDGTSPLYGTTAVEGQYDNGTAYQLTHSGSFWKYTVIHNFDTSSGPDALVMDPAGNLFGTTQLRGKFGGGLMYELASGTWKETILHEFCGTLHCADGKEPHGRLALDSAGNLFGTTYGQGSGSNCTADGGCGVVFEWTADGRYRVLHDFCSLANCADGDGPLAGPIVHGGTLFGTTDWGGTRGLGTVFKLAIDSRSESVLYSFCDTNCEDGEHPQAPVIMDKSGDLFGTTAAFGARGGGTVFELKP